MPKIETYQEWFNLHDSKHDKRLLADLTYFKIQEKEFYLRVCLLEVGPALPYKMILGYVVVDNKLKCRAWYYSGSEASWRAFTGWRKSGAWKKGTEATTDKEEKSRSELGYVFECFTTSSMSTKLADFWEKQDKVPAGEDLVPFIYDGQGMITKKPSIMNGSNRISLWDYTIDSVRSGVDSTYSSERKYVLAGLPSGLDNDTKKIIKTKGSIGLQRDFKISSLTKEMSGSGQRLSTNDVLNKWLGSRSEVDRIGARDHEALGLRYTVDRYKLIDSNNSNIHIEIASTTENRDHNINIGEPVTCSTPVVWLKDAYYADEKISSFGTRVNIPINLAFLIQKPCDYGSQVSSQYFEKRSRGGVVTYHGYISEDRRVAGGKYVILSYINEATSFLVKQYKLNKGYSTFEVKGHSKTIILDHVELRILKGLVLKGIEEYRSLRDNGERDWGFHGEMGLKRARSLFYAIIDSRDTEGFCTVLVNCFIKNKITVEPFRPDEFILHNGIPRESFTGGFGSGINTNSTSLFTCVCRAFLNETSIPSNRSSNIDEDHRYTRGAISGVYRMIYYVRNENINNEDRDEFITSNAAELLNRLRPIQG